jgi:hypothetical protein
VGAKELVQLARGALEGGVQNGVAIELFEELTQERHALGAVKGGVVSE